VSRDERGRYLDAIRFFSADEKSSLLSAAVVRQLDGTTMHFDSGNSSSSSAGTGSTVIALEFRFHSLHRQFRWLPRYRCADGRFRRFS
jgi:hypothetical protein